MNKYEFIKTLAEIQEKDLLSVWELAYDGRINYKQLQSSDDMETIYQQFGKTIFPTKKALTKHLDRRNNKWDRHSYSIKLKPTEKLLEILNEKQRMIVEEKGTLSQKIILKIKKHPHKLTKGDVSVTRVTDVWGWGADGYVIEYKCLNCDKYGIYYKTKRDFIEIKRHNR